MAGYLKHEAQDWAWEALRGQWSTLVTPFTPDDAFDEAGMRRNIRHIQSLGTRGAGCTWAMGEFWSLTFDERKHVIATVADESRGKLLSGAHVTHTSTKDMLALAQHAEDVGIDLLMVAPPYMVAKTEDQVFEYVKLLAGNTPMAIMFYNSPQFGFIMSPQGLKRLCQIPNVVGVKEASFNQQTSIETHLLVGKDAVISTPDEWIFPKAQELGFHQQVMFANTSDWRFDTPESNSYVQFIERATSGDLDLDFYNTHLKDLKALSDKWWGGTVKKYNGVLPATMCKYWGELMGMAGGGVRSPLIDLTPDEKAELRRELTPLIPQPIDRTIEKKAPARARSHASWLNEKSEREIDFSGMMLLVSVQNLPEALEADRGGADIIDVKNLQEALVGSGHPDLVESVREGIPGEKHVSVTLGVVPNQAGTVAMAVRAAGTLNATSVKVGFCETDYDSALEVLKESRRALKGYDTKLIGSLFADNQLFGGLEARQMVKLARESECDGFLIDTLTKDGRNLFDFIPEGELREMVMEAKQYGLSTALSGHLRLSDLDELARINPDIVGVRGAVCRSGERDMAVAAEAVAHFKQELDLRKTGVIDVRHRGNGNGAANGSNGGWVVVDGRGKNCAGVIAALTRQIDRDCDSFVEAILHDALNIYDVIYWAEQAGHRLITQRKDNGGLVRVLIQPGVNGR